MTGECLSVSAQMDKCQTSLAVKAQPHEWHGIAGCSETAPNKPLPSQDCAFETRYSSVFSLSNNTVQQCPGNLMTHSSDCLGISAVVLWQELQQESGKHHWVSLHLSAQKDKSVFRFLFILLVDLSFTKKKLSSLFSTALNKSLWTHICDSSEGGHCAMWSWCHRPRDHATGFDMEKQRPRTEATARYPLTRSRLSLTVLKTQTLFLWGH